MYSKMIQNVIEKLCKNFCKKVKVRLVFTSYKLCQTFTQKFFDPSVLSSKIVYKFVCASCNASYVGQRHRHLTARIDEHFGKDQKSHTYQHLILSADSLNACLCCFSILDTARTKPQLQIKESLFIKTLNKQMSHPYIISLSIFPLMCQFHFPLLHFLLVSYTFSDALRQVGFLDINSIFNS